MDENTTTTTAPPSSKLRMDVKAEVRADALYESALKCQGLAIKVQEHRITFLRHEIAMVMAWADRNRLRAENRSADGGTYSAAEVARTFSTLRDGLKKALAELV
jgi:hypothetical protein